MSEKRLVDCIIVGAGPAGVSTAIALARKGKKAIILDKKALDQIGDKVCGDALDIFSVKYISKHLDISPPNGEEVNEQIKKGTIATRNASITRFDEGYIINRHVYGQRLLKECIDSGIEVIDKVKVVGLLYNNSFVTGVKYRRNGEEKELKSKLVIDCSGAIGAVRRHLSPDFSEGLLPNIADRHTASSYREIIELDNEHDFKEEIVIIYDPEIPVPGYIWKFPKGKKLANVGTGWLKSQKTEEPMRKIYQNAMNKYFKDTPYRILRKGGGLITMRPPLDCMTFNGGLLVGEAACMTDPLSAKGHGPALVSGVIAGKVINKALENGKYTRESLWDYNVEIMNLYGVINAISLITSKYLNNISEKDMEFALRRELISAEELNAVFLGEKVDISLKVILSKIVKAFPRFNLLIKIRKLLLEVDKITEVYETYPKDPKYLTEWRRLRDKLMNDTL